METSKNELLQRSVIRLLVDAKTAINRFTAEWDWWTASSHAPQGQLLIHHKGMRTQTLEIAVLARPEMYLDLGESIATACHNLRVARDRVEKAKRALGLTPAEWPPQEPIWDLIIELDNNGKHQTYPGVEAWICNAKVQVIRKSEDLGSQLVGTLEVNAESFKPVVGVQVFALVQVIPKEWRGPEYWYGLEHFLEPRFDSNVRNAPEQRIMPLISAMIKSGAELERVVARHLTRPTPNVN